MYIVGFFYTKNITNGIFELEKKLSLFILPIILFTSPSLRESKLRKILTFFVVSSVSAVLLCLFVAVKTYFIQYDISVFYYRNLSEVISIHPVYLSMYLCFSIFIILDYLFNNWHYINLSIRWLCLCGIVFLLISILLLSSKTVIAALFIFMNLFFLLIFHRRKKIMLGASVIIFTNTLILGILSVLPFTKNRFREVIESDFSVIHQKDYAFDTFFTGATLRLTVWKFSAEILSENHNWIFGLGTGDVQDALNKIYAQKNVYMGNEDHGYENSFLNVNAHNQYIETLLALGVIGLIYLLYFFIKLIVWSIKYNNYLYLGFLILFITCCITESMMNTQKGVVFFAFFNSIFAFNIVSNN